MGVEGQAHTASVFLLKLPQPSPPPTLGLRSSYHTRDPIPLGGRPPRTVVVSHRSRSVQGSDPKASDGSRKHFKPHPGSSRRMTPTRWGL